MASLHRRFNRGYMFSVIYPFSRSIDTFSDEGLFQIEHDQFQPRLNRALSDFHRKHRLIMCWTWDLPFRGNRWIEGWQVAGIGTLQSGRPFTIVDNDFSGILFSSQYLSSGSFGEITRTRGGPRVVQLGLKLRF